MVMLPQQLQALRLHNLSYRHSRLQHPFSVPDQRSSHRSRSSEHHTAVAAVAPGSWAAAEEQQQQQVAASRRAILAGLCSVGLVSSSLLQPVAVWANPLEELARQVTRPSDITPLDAAVALLDARAILKDMTPLVGTHLPALHTATQLRSRLAASCSERLQSCAVRFSGF